MSSTPQKAQNVKKSQATDEIKEEPIPFLVYDSNTKSK